MVNENVNMHKQERQFDIENLKDLISYFYVI